MTGAKNVSEVPVMDRVERRQHGVTNRLDKRRERLVSEVCERGFKRGPVGGRAEANTEGTEPIRTDRLEAEETGGRVFLLRLVLIEAVVVRGTVAILPAYAEGPATPIALVSREATQGR